MYSNILKNLSLPCSLRIYCISFWYTSFGMNWVLKRAKRTILVSVSAASCQIELTRHIFWCSRHRMLWPGAASRGRKWGIWWAWRDLRGEKTSQLASSLSSGDLCHSSDLEGFNMADWILNQRFGTILRSIFDYFLTCNHQTAVISS